MEPVKHMKHPGFTLLAASFGALVLGALLLQGLAAGEASDPTASADNGAPQGLLALALFWEQRGHEVTRRHSFDVPWPEGEALVVVPPPEGSVWTAAEARALLDRVDRQGLLVLVACDEEPQRARRLEALLGALGARCEMADSGQREASGTLPGFSARLFVRGGGRVTLTDDAPAIPAWTVEGGEGVAVRVYLGRGAVTVLGSASVLSNDGLAEGDNARFAAELLPAGARVVFDEAHHQVRGQQVLSEAFGGLGPRLAGLALALLVPAVLLGFAPRRGDAPPPAASDAFLATRTAAEALGALYETATPRRQRPTLREAGATPALPDP